MERWLLCKKPNKQNPSQNQKTKPKQKKPQGMDRKHNVTTRNCNMVLLAARSEHQSCISVCSVSQPENVAHTELSPRSTSASYFNCYSGTSTLQSAYTCFHF